MRIYNTLTKTKQEFKPIKPNQIGIYTCGPTVYDFIHIGNARPVIVFDVLRRYLEYRGYQVSFIQNFTDIDDKIIQKSKELNQPAFTIAEQFIEEYFVDAKGLGVMPATVHPKVTEYMDAIIQTVETLIKKEYAYVINGDVYFSAKKFDSYGKLSHMPLDDLETGARIAVDEQKNHPLDFAIWKVAKPGEPSWETPWGKGRPGWHIECTAMAQTILGDTIDLHCGGQDLVFPHHENEIAQSEAASGKIFAHYWMHNGYVNIDNKKMSKSTGNFLTVREISKKYGYEPIRFLMLQAHYRSPINYSTDILEQCKSALDRLYECKRNLQDPQLRQSDKPISKPQQQSLAIAKKDFLTAMEDDCNTADALTAIFELVREINRNFISSVAISAEYLKDATELFEELTGVLGLLLAEINSEIPQKILDLVEKRRQAREEKDFEQADSFRKEIINLGYQIQETRQGTRITKL